MKKVLVTIIILFAISNGNSQRLEDILSTDEKIYHLSRIWKGVHYNFAFIDELTFDLDSLYKTSVLDVLEAKNRFEYIGVLSHFLQALNDGHTGLGLSQWYWDQADYPPVFIKSKKGSYYVKMISTFLSKEIPLNSELIEVDGEVSEKLSKNFNFKYNGLLGIRGSEVRLKFKTPKGSVVEKCIVRNYNELWKQGKVDLKSENKSVEKVNNQNKVILDYTVDGKIMVLELNSFQDAEVVDYFKTKIDTINKFSCLIIDVRANGGGNSDYALLIAKHLVKSKYILTESWKTRTHNAAKSAWASINRTNPSNPYDIKYKAYYNTLQWEVHPSDTIQIPMDIKRVSVPIVILTGKNTFSAAEDFLIYLDSDPSMKRIGQASAGSSGQPLSFEIFDGALVRICAKRDAMPDGTDYIGFGVIPHIEVDMTVDALPKAVHYILENK